MSEHEAPPVEDTPTDADTQAEVDWRKRYEDLQPEYTRKSQRLSELESDQQKWLAHGQENWPDLFDDESEEVEEFEDDDEEPEPPAPKPDARVEWLVAQEAAREFDRDLNKFVGDRDLSDGAREWIEARSQATGHNAKALENAVEAYFKLEDQIFERRLKSHKTSKKAPRVTTGKAGTQVPDLDNRSERLAHMNAMYADLSADD